MALARLDATNFRCIARAELEIDPGLTVITGPNASGKTSLLEAIFFLSCGRSFRTPRLAPLIRAGTDDLYVVGRVAARERKVVLGVHGSRGGLECRVSGETVRGLSEHARLLPVQAIDPEIHKVLEEGPARRRRYLDWGVFHVEHTYVDCWRRYQRALRQRNAALKQRLPVSAVEIWEGELVDLGESVVASRERYLQAVMPIAREIVEGLLGLDLTLVHHRGWPQDREFALALREARARDQQSGATSVGPHRADVGVRVAGVAAKERVSRGQQKLLAAALVLAQIEHRGQITGQPSTLLIDDPAAELDRAHLDAFLERVGRTPAQLIVTALDPRSVEGLPVGRLFHVEQGKVRQVL
jgi:DNA replication and repair protein RecF